MLKTHFRWGFSVQKDNYITKGPSNNRCWRYNELLLRYHEYLATHCRSLNGYAFWVRKESLAWWIRTNENRIREWERKGIETMGPCKLAFTLENPCSNCLNLLSNFLLFVGLRRWHVWQQATAELVLQIFFVTTLKLFYKNFGLWKPDLWRFSSSFIIQRSGRKVSFYFRAKYCLI